MRTCLVQYLGCLWLIPAFHKHLAGAVPEVSVADPAFHEHLAGAVPEVSVADPSIS